MRTFIRYLILIFPGMLLGFEPYPVTPYPVVGYEEVPFQDNGDQLSRNLLIWYPVNPQIEGTASKNPWDVVNVAMGAPPQTSEAKMPVIVVSHGYGGNPHQLSWLIRQLVYGGYIVLGIHHLDLSNQGNTWKRPQDISTLIDRFTAHPMANYANLESDRHRLWILYWRNNRHLAHLALWGPSNGKIRSYRSEP